MRRPRGLLYKVIRITEIIIYIFIYVYFELFKILHKWYHTSFAKYYVSVGMHK